MVRGGEISIPAAPARWAMASTCSAPPTERARCAQPVWLLSALACCRRLGHQLYHHLIVDSNKIGGKAGVGLAKVFSLMLAAKKSTSGPDVELLGPQGEMGNFMVNLRAETLTTRAGQTIMLATARF